MQADASQGHIPGSAFAEFVDPVAKTQKKQQLIERFLSDSERFPVIGGDSLAHFIYTGDADEVSITGDHTGRRINRLMHRVEGTDLFYYSSRFEPDARITYHFNVDVKNNVVDPRNPHEINSLSFRKAFWFGMPPWTPSDHLGGKGRERTGYPD